MEDIHTIRPPIEVGFDPELIKLFIIVFVCVSLIVFLFFMIRKWIKKNKSPINVEGVPEPPNPFESAIKELEELKKDQSPIPKIYYFRLNMILRKYIGGTFRINSMEMTSEEFIRQIKILEIAKELKHEIIFFQNFCDPIKYAGKTADTSRLQNDISLVNKLIEKIESRTQETGNGSDLTLPVEQKSVYMENR